MAPILILLPGCTQGSHATATPTKKVPGSYKGVVITGQFSLVTALQAKDFDNRVGYDGKLNGGIGTSDFLGAERFIDHPENPFPKQACIYFTVPFSGADILDTSKYLELIENGDLPFT